MDTDINALVVSHKPVNTTIVKRLLLIFDHVYIFHPKENLSFIPSGVDTINYEHPGGGITSITSACGYCPLYNGSVYSEQEEQTISQLDYAFKHGWLRIEDPRITKFYEKYWLPMRLAYDFDTGNPDLLNIAKPFAETSPNFLAYNGILRGGFAQPDGIKIYPDIPEPITTLFDFQEAEIYKTKLQIYSMIGRLNRSLVMAGDQKLIPAFVTKPMQELYLKKNDIARVNKEPLLLERYASAYGMPLLNVQYLLTCLSKSMLTDAELDNIPIKEFVIARNNTFHELHKLRRNLLTSINFLSSEEFDETFVTHVEEYINREVVPQYVLYSQRFCETIEKFIKYPVSFITSATAGAIGVSQGLSPLQIALYSGISATVGAIANDLTNYIITKRSEKMRNTFGYFTNFR